MRSPGDEFPERLEDYVAEYNPVRAVDAFVDQLDLFGLGIRRVDPSVTGRPGYHPSILLKVYIYGYLNRVQSSRRLGDHATGKTTLLRLLRELLGSMALLLSDVTEVHVRQALNGAARPVLLDEIEAGDEDGRTRQICAWCASAQAGRPGA